MSVTTSRRKYSAYYNNPLSLWMEQLGKGLAAAGAATVFILIFIFVSAVLLQVFPDWPAPATLGVSIAAGAMATASNRHRLRGINVRFRNGALTPVFWAKGIALMMLLIAVQHLAYFSLVVPYLSVGDLPKREFDMQKKPAPIARSYAKKAQGAAECSVAAAAAFLERVGMLASGDRAEPSTVATAVRNYGAEIGVPDFGSAVAVLCKASNAPAYGALLRLLEDSLTASVESGKAPGVGKVRTTDTVSVASGEPSSAGKGRTTGGEPRMETKTQQLQRTKREKPAGIDNERSADKRQPVPTPGAFSSEASSVEVEPLAVVAGEFDTTAPEEPQIVEPILLSQKKLRYPRVAARKGVQGVVRVRFDISRIGKTENAEVLTSSGDWSLDRAAVKWVEKRRYLPKTVDGEPVVSSEEISVEFKL